MHEKLTDDEFLSNNNSHKSITSVNVESNISKNRLSCEIPTKRNSQNIIHNFAGFQARSCGERGQLKQQFQPGSSGGTVFLCLLGNDASYLQMVTLSSASN